MNKAITKQIQRIKASYESVVLKLQGLLTDADTIVSLGVWRHNDIHRILRLADIYDKKATDSAISLNTIYKDRVYDNYETDAASFFKNAVYFSDTAPDTAQALHAFSFNVQYTNNGLFNAWTAAKNIQLRVRVYRSSGTPQLFDPLVIPLNVALPQNIPGDELTNGDYNKTKIFNVTTDTDYSAGTYLFTYTIIDNNISISDYDTYFANSLYSKTITIT
jgi:hypothetical protein